MPIPVSVDNFVRAETDRMFAGLVAPAQGVNRWLHYREPTPLDQQTVIRMNRDTLYSAAIVDISTGATLTLPDGGDRYVSAMVVNQDHYVNQVYHQPGKHELTVDEFDTPWVVVAARILVDPTNADDVATVNALQDRLNVEANSSQPFAMPTYDTESFDATRRAVLELAKHGHGFDNAAGKRGEVDEVKHLLVTAAGWGALPDSEARYIPVFPDKPVAEYRLTVGDVPVDGFWSVSVYNKDGFFEPNDRNAYSVNNLTAAKNDDGSVTVHFGGDDDRPNLIPITEGWNYLVRLYRPRAEARLGGAFSFPPAEPA
jgi:hypothetical protein